MNTYTHFKNYTRCPLDIDLAEVSDDSLEHYLFEKYIDNVLHQQAASVSIKSIIRGIYYRLRPLFPVTFRKHLQRMALRGWRNISFPAWPVDTTVDDHIADGFRHLLTDSGYEKIPFIWFWPRGHRYAAIMTHDVETAAGRDFTSTMMEMEAKQSIVSSFEVVPEVRYEVSDSYLESIRAGGCEVCLHGLNHDGHLFDDPVEFNRRAHKIKHHADRFGAGGFRSPIMYRNLDWLDKLPITHDMSVPNTAHLDPQRGGCCTVMPYFINELLELPLTTIQDYSLFNILNDYSLDLWRQQAAIVKSRFGLRSFITHPDYIIPNKASKLYEDMLAWLAELRDEDDLWLTLPQDVNVWWRERAAMKIEEQNGTWVISGSGSENAVLAFACLQDGQLQYELETGRSWRGCSS